MFLFPAKKEGEMMAHKKKHDVRYGSRDCIRLFLVLFEIFLLILKTFFLKMV